MTTKQIFKGAAERLRTKGWCQGSYGRMAEGVMAMKQDGGKTCRAVPAGSPCGAAGNLLGTPVAETDVIGALRQVGKSDPNVDKAKAQLADMLGVNNLADWNDEDGRTADEVIAALELAAA